jgi:hypothetical protein
VLPKGEKLANFEDCGALNSAAIALQPAAILYSFKAISLFELEELSKALDEY